MPYLRSLDHLGRSSEVKKYKINQLPKGNMWSAIPVALLCTIVNRSERKQGSGPGGDEVLENTEGLSFVLLSPWES